MLAMPACIWLLTNAGMIWLACSQLDVKERIWAPWCPLNANGFPRELTPEEQKLYGGDVMSVRRAIGAVPKWGGPAAAQAYLGSQGEDVDLSACSDDHLGAGGSGESLGPPITPNLHDSSQCCSCMKAGYGHEPGISCQWWT